MLETQDNCTVNEDATAPPLPSGRVWLANVGVNASHIGKGLQSPRLVNCPNPDDNGTFELVTIPELPAFQLDDSRLVRYRQLRGQNIDLSRFIPARWHNTVTHYDPEFEHFTYGDDCGRAARAVALRKILPGDFLYFIARLADYDLQAERWTGRAGFYIIGYLAIATILADVRGPVAGYDRLAHNAHLRRAAVRPDWYNGFYVFEGEPTSRRFRIAKPFGRAEAERFLRDKNGLEWRWQAERSDLQTIGSYTRTCRCVLDRQRNPDEAARWRDWMITMCEG